nr:hypothetical protein Hi04_10k_c4003_00033 [uncultured bacterium]
MVARTMFLRAKVRKKDGKQHRYFSVVENRRVARNHTVQRTVLYLGEINDSQEATWLGYRFQLAIVASEKRPRRKS